MGLAELVQRIKSAKLFEREPASYSSFAKLCSDGNYSQTLSNRNRGVTPVKSVILSERERERECSPVTEGLTVTFKQDLWCLVADLRAEVV